MENREQHPANTRIMTVRTEFTEESINTLTETFPVRVGIVTVPPSTACKLSSFRVPRQPKIIWINA